MIHLLPAPIHRLGLRLAHRARVRVWRMLGSQVRGCNVLAFDPAGRLLLVRHSYHQPDRWLLPGGGLARGEDPAATGARELLEETACRLDGAVWFGTDLVDRKGWINRIELIAGTTADVPQADGRELVEAAFFALDALPETLGEWPRRYIALWHDWRAARSEG